MAVPKTKVSKSRRNMRFAANFKAKANAMGECPHCHATVNPHHVCKECGQYKGTKVLESKVEKQERKTKSE